MLIHAMEVGQFVMRELVLTRLGEWYYWDIFSFV